MYQKIFHAYYHFFTKTGKGNNITNIKTQIRIIK